jgi:cell wall-active antibiotic response 4TMS protein YvqF
MRRGGGSWLALGLIGLGVFFLLRQIDVIPTDIAIGPIALIVLGGVLLVVAVTTRFGEAGLVVPFVLLALGIVLLLRDRGAVSKDFSVWPAVLIAVGAGLLLSGAIGGSAWGGTAPR